MSNYRVIKWKEIYAPNMGSLRAVMAGEGFQISQWSEPPTAVYGWNKHSFERSHWVISGSLKITIKDVGTFVLKAGDRDMIPAETYYHYRVEGGEPVLYFVGEKAKIEEKKKRGRSKRK